MEFKVGDIIEDLYENGDNDYQYCNVTKIGVHVFWGYWSKTLDNIKEKELGKFWVSKYNTKRFKKLINNTPTNWKKRLENGI